MAEAIYATSYDKTGGRNPYLSVNPGFANGKQFTLMGWIKPSSVAESAVRIVRAPFGVIFHTASATGFRFSVENTSGGLINRCTANGALAAGTWYHVIASVDQTDVNKRHLLVNGQIINNWTGDYSDEDIHLAGSWNFNGSSPSFPGCSTEWWAKEAYFDLSDGDELAKFFAGVGIAADMGANGELPDGGSPPLYLRGQYPNHHINSGTGPDCSTNDVDGMSECVDAPARESGGGGAITMGFTNADIPGAFMAYSGILVATAPNCTGQVRTVEALPYVREVSPDGETVEKIWEDAFDTCNWGTLDNNTKINNIHCNNFQNTELVGTVTRKQSSPGNYYAEMKATLQQAQTLGNNHTMLRPIVGVWKDKNRRLEPRKHYRWLFDMRLGADFNIAQAGWMILWQIKQGNINGALNAPGGGNPTIDVGAYADNGKYSVHVKGSPKKGGPLVQGDFTTPPGGTKLTLEGGNYFNDVNIWRRWQIDYFNSNDPNGPDPATDTDGFIRIKVGNDVICDIKDEVIGLWFNDVLTNGAESFTFGIYNYPGEYGNRDVVTVDVENMQIFEVTQGGSQEIKPDARLHGEILTDLATPLVRLPSGGSEVMATQFIT